MCSKSPVCTNDFFCVNFAYASLNTYCFVISVSILFSSLSIIYSPAYSTANILSFIFHSCTFSCYARVCRDIHNSVTTLYRSSCRFCEHFWYADNHVNELLVHFIWKSSLERGKLCSASCSRCWHCSIQTKMSSDFDIQVYQVYVSNCANVDVLSTEIINLDVKWT